MAHLLRASLLAPLALSAALSACSTNLRDYTGSVGNLGAMTSPSASIEALAARYDARPGEKRVSLDYAAALRGRGQTQQAVAVLQRASLANIGDKDVAAAYGKALADVGRFDEALGTLEVAQSEDRPDWRVLSTIGSIHDQMGNHKHARDAYMRALQIAPRQPMVLNNLGLSYLLTQETAKAEEALAEAAAQPGADARVQANLDLARSLRAQGAKGQAGKVQAGKAQVAPAARAATQHKQG